MKSKFLVLVFAVVLGVGISAWAFGADGQIQQVQMQPLVNFDGFFENITEWFTDILKHYWLLLLSIFFVWISVRYGRAMLYGDFYSIQREVDRQEREREVAMQREEVERE